MKLLKSMNIDPFSFWQRLGLTSFAVLSLPSFDIVEIVEKVEENIKKPAEDS
jgi:hypothetical protein